MLILLALLAFSLPQAQQYQVSMAGLAGGNYHLYVKDQQGNSYHFLIVKVD